MSKILCVDDSALVRSELKRIVVEAGFSFVEARDGNDALQVLNDHPDIRMVFCDVNMPVMDGRRFCVKLSEQGKIGQLSVFMLTTEIAQDLKDELRALGVKGWLLKPVDAKSVKIVLNYKK